MYLGPETLMPLASILAGIGGILVMFWHRAVMYFRRAYQFLTGLFVGS